MLKDKILAVERGMENRITVGGKRSSGALDEGPEEPPCVFLQEWGSYGQPC
ncbi:MAG: hypothetical protein KatS3mg106_732 [Gemmataceae bacterium]|nr:MAG: hypothetical protein KatS3mg106_184 [Gemmataceae bacterium]GIW84219.1 MAG: hypothetical protein KatS3mg106_732 [Gemmataceae bacterium]